MAVGQLYPVPVPGTASSGSGGGVDPQTGTTYTVVSTDSGKLVTFSNASAVAVTLPQATTTGFTSGFVMDVENLGVGTVTITPTTSTIDGAASITLATDQGLRIFSDGTNYFTQRGRSAAAITSGGVNNQTGVTYTISSTDRAKLVTFSNAAAIAVTLPQGGTASINNTWYTVIENRGVGMVTITPGGGSTIDGVGSAALRTDEGISLYCDGSNYFTAKGFARMQNIFDVSAAGSANGQLLIYDSGALQWKPATITAGTNITVTNGPGTISISTTGGGSGSANNKFTKEVVTRLINTSYQNTSGKLKLVSVVLGLSGANGDFATLCDASATPVTQVASISGSLTTGGYPMLFLVPNNFFYKFTATASNGFVLVTEFTCTVGSETDSGDLGPAGTNTRLVNTAYQNTSGGTMLVVSQFTGCSGNNVGAQGLSDSSNPPTTVIFANSPENSKNSVYMFVQSGDWYEVTSPNGSLAFWHEYAISGLTFTRSADLVTSRLLGTSTGQAPYWQNGSGGNLVYVVIDSSNASGTTFINSDGFSGKAPTTTQYFKASPASYTCTVFGIDGGLEYLVVSNDSGTPAIAHWYEYTVT